MGLTIHALPAGVIRGFPKPAITYHRGWHEQIDTPQIIFVILGGEHPVVVDTGTPPPEFVRRHHGYDFHRPEHHEPAKVLAGIGVEPGDVHTVINTHLHWDHCGSNDLFTKARFFIQREELHYAVDPAEPNRVAFERVDGLTPPWMPVLGRIETVTGEAEVEPGITVVPLPGHTPGSQGVLVRTDAGPFLLAGDCIDTYENWRGDGTLEHIPSGSFTNLVDYMDSFRRMEALGAEVIPSHDPLVLERKVFG
ncbi:MAG: N-acyl homoserine lactonase family protein [Pseudonocardia sp.]|nr:N-acyl homoserine lactonase family protein [Pseudonocardia sp.]